MMILENELISAAFNAKGAELQKLIHKGTGLSYLWGGDPVFWAKHSPILFPIVGALKNAEYQYEGKTYKLPRHGFARDREFQVQQIGASEMLFTLSDDADTLAVYPFKFLLGIRYKIEGASLSCTYEILNPGDKVLLFSIGGHPAFAAPVQEEINYDDCFLEFNRDAELTYHKIKEDLIDDETLTINLNEGKLDLNHKLFYEDALVFKTLKSDRISIKNTKTPNGLHFNFETFPFFGIWAAKDADFVCLEPWCGIADGINHNQQLKDKEGIIQLEPGASWQHNWNVEVF
jgi:galactose mutarotase-like enzyme